MNRAALILFSVIVLVFSVALTSVAFVGPGANPPSGSGAIGVNDAMNVSFGSATPQANTKLVVVASSTASGDYAWRILQPGGATVMAVRNDGNVGVGTASPGSLFVLRRSSAGAAFTIRNTADSADVFSVDATGALTAGSIPWTRLSSFPTGCAAGSAVQIVSGTLTCISVPTLSGTTNYMAKFTAATTIGNSQVFDNGTNVGIGTASPGYKLEVNGDAKIGSNSRLILGSKADPDPTGVNGAIYYNTTNNKFRCYENNSWKNCVGTAVYQ